MFCLTSFGVLSLQLGYRILEVEFDKLLEFTKKRNTVPIDITLNNIYNKI